MSSRLAKLEGLLARVQNRAAEPRPLAQAAGKSDTAPEEDGSLEARDGYSAVSEVDEIDDVEIDPFDEMDAPESGQVAATTLEDAIEAAEHQPPMTPPPESGEGIMSPQIPPREGPTMEQLGETISLDEGFDQELELDEPTLDEPSLDDPESEREAELRRRAPALDEPLLVPENAREELERVRLGDATPILARVSSRPVISTNVVALISSSRSYAPLSFLELIDSSLSLK